jgi:CBS domain containing-hemolysin-like protein
MKLMLGFLFAAVLLLIALTAVTLRKTYFYVPAKELKRQAEAGDALASTLYRAVAYGSSLRALLWIVIALSSAGGFLLLSAVAPPAICFVAIAALLWLAFSWLPNTRVTTVGARLAAWSTPAIAKILSYLHPLLGRLASPFHKHYHAGSHTGLFEAGDILELLEKQQNQGDNRIPSGQLDMVKRMLSAHQYKVAEVLTPRADIKTVSDNETISLVLLDELHATNQSSFPVRRGNSDKITGTLYLDDLNLKTEGKVSDYMQHDVRYVHEDDSLNEALQAFFKTKHQLFVVVNSFEEYVGVLTLEHVMLQLMGDVGGNGFDQHHDIAAVANKHAHDDDEPEAEEPETVEMPPAEAADEVTEPEPESELVTDEPPAEAEEAGESAEPEVEEVGETVPEETEEPGIEEVSMEDEATEEPSGSLTQADPDSLAALDLPEETEEHETFEEGSHVEFKKPNKKK